MDRLRNLLVCAFILTACFFIVDPSAFADVRLELKNGSAVTADDCRENKESFTCSKMGGLFEIEKKDVVRVSNFSSETSGREVSAEPEKRSLNGNAGENKEDPEKAAAGSGMGDPGKRLEAVRRRKQELSKEREDLVKQRDLLRDEVKNAPNWMTQKQFSELKKKSSDFDGRLKNFNDEITQLNNVEKEILEKSATKVNAPEANPKQ